MENEEIQKAQERSVKAFKDYVEAVKLISSRFGTPRIPSKCRLIFEWVSVANSMYFGYSSWQLYSDGYLVHATGKRFPKMEPCILSRNIYRYKGISEEVQEIIDEYEDKLKNLSSDFVNTPTCDGYTDYFTFGKYTFSGNNIFSFIPKSEADSKWETLFTVKKLYRKIDEKIGEYHKGLV